MKKALYLASYYFMCFLVGMPSGMLTKKENSKKTRILGFILLGVTGIATFITGLAVGDELNKIDEEELEEKEKICS